MGETIQLIIAGIFQGITELLPVSSSGHLLLLSHILEGDFAILEIAILHIGTLGSILFIFRDNLKLYLNKTFVIKILLSIIPASIIGFILEIVGVEITSPSIVISTLIFWGIALIATDFYSKKHYDIQKNDINLALNNISYKQAIIVGIGQCLALIPGTSRSGVTTIFAIFSGIAPQNAITFSFLSGIPLIAMSGGYASLKILRGHQLPTSNFNILLGTITAFFVGLLSAYILKRFINKKLLTACGIYRIIIGIILIGIYIL